MIYKGIFLYSLGYNITIPQERKNLSNFLTFLLFQLTDNVTIKGADESLDGLIRAYETHLQV